MFQNVRKFDAKEIAEDGILVLLISSIYFSINCRVVDSSGGYFMLKQ